MALNLSEHIAGLTMVGFYYLFMDNELGAETCWKTAVKLLPLGMFMRGKIAGWDTLS